MEDNQNDIGKYLRGELGASQMHELEKRALSDPFMRDALEGGSTVEPTDFTADVTAINNGLKGGGKTIWFTPLRIAAGVALLGAAVLFVVLNDTADTRLAQTEQSPVGGEQKRASEEKAADSVQQTQPDKKDQLLSLNKPDNKPEKTTARKKVATESAAAPLPTQLEPTVATEDVAAGLELAEKTAEKESREVVRDTVRIADELFQAPKLATADEQKREVTTRSAQQLKSAGARSSGFADASRAIKGQVKSTDGQPLPGVNILIKGTTTGTVSDINGNYSITTNTPDPTLVFSFVGLQTSEVDAKNKADLDVTLAEDLSQLSEVVVTGTSLATDDLQSPVIRLAEPFGGRKAYDKYLDANLHYPDEALAQKIKGRVLIEFTVATDGSLTDFNVLRSLGHGCDEEVIRLVKQGPKWFPTTQNNVPVESNVRVRMKFDPAKARK